MATKTKYHLAKTNSGHDVDILTFERPGSVRAVNSRTERPKNSNNSKNRQQMTPISDDNNIIESNSMTINEEITIKYPSGNIALVCTPDRGNGVFHNFYDDKRKPKVIASFKEGIGFASFPDGKARFVVNKRGGMVMDTRGTAIQQWAWAGTYRESPGPDPPVLLQLNPCLRLACTNRHEIVLTLRRQLLGSDSGFAAEEMPINVGVRRAPESYLQRLEGRDKIGRLKVRLRGSKTLTLKERQQLHGHDPGFEAILNAQRNGWRLPKVSASGRELQKVELRGDLTQVGSSLTEMQRTLKGFRTEISQNVFDSTQSLRASHSRPILQSQPLSRSGILSLNGQGDGFAASQNNATSLQRNWTAPKFETLKPSPSICPAKVRRRKTKTVPLEVIPAKRLLRFSKDEAGDYLVIACLSTRNTSECKAAEKLLTRIQTRWHSLGEEAKDFLSAYHVILVDCSRDSVLSKKYNFEVYPMYLMFYNGKLAYASSTFNGFGNSEEDFMAQIERTYKEAKRGVFLSDDFHFPSMSEMTLKTVV